MSDLYRLIALVVVVFLIVRTAPRNWVTARDRDAPALQRWFARVQLVAQPLLVVSGALALLPLGRLSDIASLVAVVLVGVVLLASLAAVVSILASGQRR